MNLNLVFLKSKNLNLKITKKMNGSNPAAVPIRGGVLEDVLGLENVLEDTF